MAKTGQDQGIIAGMATMFEEHFESLPEKSDQDTKRRKSKKKAMKEIIAVQSGRNRGKAGKNKGKKKAETSSVAEEDSEDDSESIGISAGNFKQAQCDVWKNETLAERKKNKLAVLQQMPYFDGDYWKN